MRFRLPLAGALLALALAAAPAGAAQVTHAELGLRSPAGPLVTDPFGPVGAASARRWSARPPAAAMTAIRRTGGVAFGGTTAQREPVVVISPRRPRSVGGVIIDWSAPCDDGRIRGTASTFSALPRRNARFGGTSRTLQRLPRGVAVFSEAISGRVGRRAVTGRFRAIVVARENGRRLFRCDSGVITFTVRDAYGGRNAQRRATFVTTSAGSTRVTRLGTHLDLRCSSGRVRSLPFAAAADLPLSSRGRFHGRAPLLLDLGNEVGTGEQDVVGRLGSRSGTGTWSVRLDVADRASGSRADTCASGPVRFSLLR